MKKHDAKDDVRKLAVQTTVFKLPHSARIQTPERLRLAASEAGERVAPVAASAGEGDLRLYRDFLEGIYDAVLITTTTGWIVDNNARATESFGLTQMQFRTLRITDIICNSSEMLFNEMVAELLEGGRIVLEATCQRRDRSVFPAEIAVNCLHLSEQPNLCFMIRNSSRRVQAETALRESERRFRDISESMSDWIWEIDTQGIYTYCSDLATEVLGYGREQLVGHSIFEHGTLEQKAMGQKQLRGILLEEASFRDLEVWLKTATDTWRCIAFAGCPIFDEAAKLTGFRGIASDVTDAKTKDAELAHHRHHLEDLVQQRTEELIVTNRLLTREISERRKAESELRVAIHDLRRSNEELQQFCYVVSHDLKEPLRMISGYCRLLEQRYVQHLDEDGQEFLQYALDGADKLQRMIDDLLAYARLSTEELHTDRCDLSTICQQALRNLRFAIEESHAKIESAHLPTVMGDRTQLLLLLQNLLGNAIKFRRPEVPPHIEIAVRCQRSQQGDTAVPGYRFTVTDNGQGLPESAVNDIFLIFYRLSGEHEVEGTGIGLAICKKIVENHGGWIRMQPGEQHGAVVIFWLPAMEQDAPPA